MLTVAQLLRQFGVGSGVPSSVFGDPERLRQVFVNLLGNALKFTVTGSVVLRVTRPRADTDLLRFDVSDTGPGLPPKARENLFTPFQGGVRKGGSGLGLAISQELVRGHGGDLVLKHTGPDGTTFEISLPRGDRTF